MTTADMKAGRSTRRWALGLLLIGAVGCGQKGADAPVNVKTATGALDSAGLKTETFKDADPARFSAQKCVEGVIDGVETVVCEYGSAEAVAKGKAAGETWVAQATTGSVLSNGLSVLAVADRSKADPSGKTIQKITRAYLGKK